MGKTNMDEFGMGGTGLYSCNGIIVNALDNKRIAGGSSSGSAVTTALGEVDYSFGTDTGDSIRKPASYNGIVGVKPTYSLLSRNGVMAYDPSYDTVGFFTKNVIDSAKLVEATMGHDPKDCTSATRQSNLNTAILNGSVKNIKIAIINEIYEQYSEKYKLQFDQLVLRLKSEGANIEYVNFGKELLEAIYPTYQAITFATASSQLAAMDGVNFGHRENGETYEKIMFNTRSESFGDYIMMRQTIGSYILHEENQERYLHKAKKVRRLIIERVQNIFSNFHATLNIAAEIAPLISDVKDGKGSHVKYVDHLQIANHCGTPSITVPLGKVDNMPFSVEVMTNIFDEQQMYNLALFIENYVRREQ